MKDEVKRRVIILGDVNTGKTRLTKQILEDLIRAGYRDIVVLDWAPDKTDGIGGKIGPLDGLPVRYLAVKIVPPRLKGKTQEEVERYAFENALRIRKQIESLLRSPPSALVINDISIYIQAGDPQPLQELIEAVPVVIANGYYGRFFGNDGLSRRERARMDELRKIFDEVIEL